jgi:predicted amidohydrolase
VGDVAGNARLIDDALEGALAAGAQVIVLPELATSGYVFRDGDEAQACAIRPDDPLFEKWQRRCTARDAVVVVGFAELADGGGLFNSAAVIDASGLRAVYRKTHLWDTEKLVFEPGAAPPPVVETAHGRIGVCVCYDLAFPEVPRGLALAGAELIAHPANNPVDAMTRPYGDPIELTLVRATAHLSRVFVASCDRGGSERGVDWVGATLIADELGEALAGPPGPRSQLVLADCDLSRARDKRWNDRNDVFADRRPELYAHDER